MKRKTALILVVSLLLALFAGSVGAAELEDVSSEPQGYWQLTSVEDDVPEDSSVTTDFSSAYKRYGYQRGSLAFDWGIENSDYEETVTVDGTVSAVFTQPPEIIKPHEPLNFQISLTASHTSSVPAELHDQVYAAIELGGMIENLENSTLECSMAVTDNTTVVEEAVVAFLPSNEMITQISIYMSLSGLTEIGGTMQTIYNYDWVEEEKPRDITINLRGLSLDAIGRPMPWMKLEIYIYYDQTEFTEGDKADLKVDGSTDHAGRYNFTIPLAESGSGPIGVFIKGYLDSVFPYEDNSLLFSMIDESDAESLSRQGIAIGTWIVIDEEELDQVETGEQLNIYRLLAFYHLALDTWSVDEEYLPEPVFFFLANNNPQDRTTKLEDYSILYNAAHEAWFFGGVLLDEKEKLIGKPIKIMLNASVISQFDMRIDTIFIETMCSRRDDYSQYVLMHEFGHYFDFTTNSIADFRAGSGYGAGDTNHGGYMNKSTSDSYLEGFATAYAALVQQYNGSPAPGIVGGYPLTDPPVYKAWGAYGVDEEFAIASLLFQTNMRYTDVRDFWAVISPDRLNFYEYYNAIEADLSGGNAAWLRGFAIDSGLFKMPFGSDGYDIGEPFRDLNDNDTYDSGEPYADLMFAADAGYALFDTPLEEYNEQDLIAGEVSPANTSPDAPRYTSYRSEDSFLYLSGESLDYVLVKFKPDDHDHYSVLLPVYDNRVFVPLTSKPMTGSIEVMVPGGSRLLQASFENWQEHRLISTGAPEPLAEIEVKSADLAGEDVIYTATGGVADHDGIAEQPSIDRQVLIQTADEVEFADLNVIREQRLASLEIGGGNAPGSARESNSFDDNGNTATMLAVLIGLIIVLAAGLIIALVLFIRIDKKTV